MSEERHTFVITLEDDVAEFLDVKHKSASELNGYINQVLHAEAKRQKQSEPDYGKPGGQKSKRDRGRTSTGADWVI